MDERDQWRKWPELIRHISDCGFCKQQTRPCRVALRLIAAVVYHETGRDVMFVPDDERRELDKLDVGAQVSGWRVT